MGIAGLLSSADNLTAVILACFALAAIIRPAYRRTIGSRRSTARDLDRVVVGVPVNYVESMFGQPLLIQPWHRTETGEPITTRRLYDARHGWLIVTERDGAVVAYAFTVTDHKFSYDLTRCTYGQIKGRLGHTTYAQLYDGLAVDVASFAGAYSYSYVETHYLGRPGMYQRYALSEYGAGTSSTDPSSVFELGVIEPPEDSVVRRLEEPLAARVAQHRNRGRPDTIAVVGEAVGQAFVSRPGDDYTMGSETMRRFRAAGPRGWRPRSDSWWRRARKRLR